jgi:hypothetical protein
MNTDNILTILVSIFIPLLTGLAFIAYNNPVGYQHAYNLIAIGSIVLTIFFILLPKHHFFLVCFSMFSFTY